MSALETLLSQHRTTLSNLYTKLSPAPLPLLTSQLDLLHAALALTISEQRQAAEDEIASVEIALAAQWKKVKQWRTALGEQQSENDDHEQDDGTPLLSQLSAVEIVLNSMREQMETRGRRILALQATLLSSASILGMSWLSLEIPHEPSKEWEELDLRLERLSALEAEVVRCKNEINERTEAVNEHVAEIVFIRRELGIHSESTPSPAPMSSSIDGLEGLNTPEPDAFDELILCHLGVGGGREEKKIVPTDENLLLLEAKRQWLVHEQEHRQAIIIEMWKILDPLWSTFNYTEQDKEAFMILWEGLFPESIEAYQTEVKRMNALKRSNLADFILRERLFLAASWDSLYLSPHQRAAYFPPFDISVEPTLEWNAEKGVEEEIVNANVTEELLAVHETEKVKWEEEVLKAKPVLERLEKYFDIIKEMAELEASASDPSRLLGKSTRGDPGRLLREEKARKRVVKDKPKLEGELRRFIPIWEAENARPFLVNGNRFLDDLDTKLNAELAEKESKKRNKMVPISSAPTSNRPVPLRAQHTGSSSSSALRAQHTGGVPSTASSTGPMKRHNTGASSKGALQPAAKRPAYQVSQATGGAKVRSAAPATVSTASSILGESTNSNGSNVGGGVGMRIPAGWGGTSTSASATAYPAMSPDQQHAPPPYVQPQYTGFRPNTRLSGGKE